MQINNSVLRSTLIVMSWVIVSSCAGHSMERNFFSQSSAPAEVKEAFNSYSYSWDEQYKLFRYGNDYVEPPDMYLADVMAEYGKAIIPFLLVKLQAEPEDIGVRDIVLIFKSMEINRIYKVKDDEYLMRALSDRVARMKTAWRETALEMLEEIKSS